MKAISTKLNGVNHCESQSQLSINELIDDSGNSDEDSSFFPYVRSNYG